MKKFNKMAIDQSDNLTIAQFDFLNILQRNHKFSFVIPRRRRKKLRQEKFNPDLRLNQIAMNTKT